MYMFFVPVKPDANASAIETVTSFPELETVEVLPATEHCALVSVPLLPGVSGPIVPTPELFTRYNRFVARLYIT
jgi:hypothetical protein